MSGLLHFTLSRSFRTVSIKVTVNCDYFELSLLCDNINTIPSSFAGVLSSAYASYIVFVRLYFSRQCFYNCLPYSTRNSLLLDSSEVADLYLYCLFKACV